MARLALRPYTVSAKRGKMLRSIPTMPPTKALINTKRLNCAAFCFKPSWMGGMGKGRVLNWCRGKPTCLPQFWGHTRRYAPLKKKARNLSCGLFAWRRERDSNPRRFNPQRFSRPPQSTTLPSLRRKNTAFHEILGLLNYLLITICISNT